MQKVTLFLVFIGLLFACNNSNNNSNTIATEVTTDAHLLSVAKHFFEGVSLPQFVQKIETKRAINLKTNTEAEIVIPENAFVDKNGKNIDGEVTIKYKEIKSPSDIIVENIDMTYDSAGVTYQFQTAGMFDLRAYSGNDEVFLKKGKNIEVSYVSNKPGNYNIYYYNGQNWENQGVSEDEVPLNANVLPKNAIVPIKPVKVNPDNDLILDIDASHKHIPELAVYRKVIWKYNGDLTNEEVVKILSSKVFKNSITQTSIKGKYLYNFKTSGKEYSFSVAPVFQPKAYKKAMREYEATLAQSSAPKKTVRKVKVSQLGLMNYDILYHRSDALIVNADFKIKDEPETKVKGLPLFHITGEDDVVVNAQGARKLYYSKNLNNKIVAIFPDKTVAVMGTDDFIKAAGKKVNGKAVFELQRIDKPINTPGDLDQIISSL
jgi:hypothetical protein